MSKNNITRMLETKKIPFTTFQLPTDEKLSARETARIVGVAPEIVFKTIVVTRAKSGRPILAIIPGTNKVDIKALANIIGEKKLLLPTQNDAERLTGLQAGGISPLALLNRGFQIILDESALDYELIHISGGQRGLNIRLSVKSLIELTKAQISIISIPDMVQDNGF